MYIFTYCIVSGYGYGGSDVVAIARLRGAGLKELHIPEDCLEADESHELADEEDIENIAEVVSACYLICIWCSWWWLFLFMYNYVVSFFSYSFSCIDSFD